MSARGAGVVIRSGGAFLNAELNDSETARQVLAALPVASEAGWWGKEIFFTIPVAARSAEDAREVMQPGEIAYWPPGKALCIFLGPTPAGRGDDIRAASPVNPIGHIAGDLSALDGVRDGDAIVVERI